MARRARMTPWRTALTVPGGQTGEATRITYSALHLRVTLLANGLRALGARRGDRIGYLGMNHPAFLETMFAAGTLGAVFVPLHLLSIDVLLQAAPLYRLGGLGVVALPGLFKGAELVVTPSVDPDELLSVIERHRVTILFGSPGLFRALLESPRAAHAELSTLRFCICGGDSVPEALIRAWLERGVRFQQGYGLTEAAPLALLLDAEEMAARVGAAGRPPFFTDVRVVHPDMADAAPGENGEIVIHGPNVMLGYWGRPEATDAAITHGGWLHSGDAARVEADGHVYVLGRTADAIELAEATVYPEEIEGELYRHPAVAECAVVGFSEGDDIAVAAFVVCRPGRACEAEELLTFLAGRLPPERVPRRVELVEALPKNANGKLIRLRLRELLERAVPDRPRGLRLDELPPRLRRRKEGKPQLGLLEIQSLDSPSRLR